MSVTTTIPSTTTTINLIKNITVPEDLSWDFFNTIIQFQSTIAMTALTAVIGIALIVISINWFYSHYIFERKLKSELDDMKNSLKDEAQTIRAEMFTLIKGEIKGEIERIEAILNEEKTYIYGEQARSFAIINEQQKIWNVAVSQWAIAIKLYATTEDTEDVLRKSVDALKEDLDEVMELEDERIKQVEICLLCIPDILNKERKEIKDKLEEFKQKNKRKNTLTPNDPSTG